MEALSFALTYAIPAAFAAIGAAIVGAAAMNAAGRNPEKINDLRTMMILGCYYRFRRSNRRQSYVVFGVNCGENINTICQFWRVRES